MTRKAKIEAESLTVKKPAVLGTKRVCPKCATKFYDFEREEADCPKCGHHINFREEESVAPAVAPAPKKVAPKARQQDEDGDEAGTPSAEFESLDDLDDGDDSELIEDLDSDEDEEETY